jgi:hypothetical protein
MEVEVQDSRQFLNPIEIGLPDHLQLHRKVQRHGQLHGLTEAGHDRNRDTNRMVFEQPGEPVEEGKLPGRVPQHDVDGQVLSPVDQIVHVGIRGEKLDVGEILHVLFRQAFDDLAGVVRANYQAPPPVSRDPCRRNVVIEGIHRPSSPDACRCAADLPEERRRRR